MLQASVSAGEESARSEPHRRSEVAENFPNSALPLRRVVPPHELGSPQAVEIDAFAIGLGPSFDLAHGWDCKNGAECRNRAYAGELFPTEGEARAAVRRYMLDRCGRLFPRLEPARAYRMLCELDGLEAVHILQVQGVVAACHDYRETGCRLGDAFEQLRLGAGRGPAWHMARSNRSNYGALSARLPGRTSEGDLFAFRTACRELDVWSVETARPPAP